MELDTAVKKYEQIVAPANYKRPKAIFTKKMLEDAKKTITELGYMGALQRRFATLDDITVNNILFSNKDSAKRISGAMDLFDEMESEVAIDPKKFTRVEEISVEDFIKNVLPIAKELEVYLENKHVQNMVSLIAPENKEEKTMFKWDNGFSWAYTGNITDSDIKENVKAAGGSVTGIVRFSIQWNDGDGKDNSDLDAHCVEPGVGDHIFFGHKVSRHTNGNLDIDITHPLEQCRASKGVAVENITFPSKANMIPGTYRFYVNQYSYRNSQGFKAEIEVNGEIHSYEYNHPVRGDVDVAEVILDNEGNFKVVDKLSGNCATVSKDVWGIKTLQFVPVSVVCYSPNYWDEQKGIGHTVKSVLSRLETSGIEVSNQTKMNLPARIRMSTLYAVSQSMNGRVANTCNYSESFVGYETRYGDSAGDFSPIGYMLVTEVKAIGYVLGLPEEFIEKIPIDGLCGKTDEDNLGFPYAVLDKYIYTEKCDDPEIAKKIKQLHEKNLFKSKSMPKYLVDGYYDDAYADMQYV